MIGGIMTEKQRRKFEDHMEMDLAFSVGRRAAFARTSTCNEGLGASSAVSSPPTS